MTETPDHPARRDPIASWHATRAEAANFEDLSDVDKVKFSQRELRAASAMLDELLRRHDALRTEVADPAGLLRLTLGNDGRLVGLFVHEAIGQQLDHIGFETLFNSLLAAGNLGVQASLREFQAGGFDEV